MEGLRDLSLKKIYQENPRKTLGKPWKTPGKPGKTLGKPLENPGKTLRLVFGKIPKERGGVRVCQKILSTFKGFVLLNFLLFGQDIQVGEGLWRGKKCRAPLFGFSYHFRLFQSAGRKISS